MWMQYVGCALVSMAILVFGVLLWLHPAKRRLEEQLAEARKLREQIEKEVQTKRKEILLEAKDEAHRIRAEVERENRDKRVEIQRLERRLTQKEEALDRRLENLERKEKSLAQREQEAARLRDELSSVIAGQREELQRISGLSAEDAKNLLLKMIEDETKHEAARLIRDIEAQAREEAD